MPMAKDQEVSHPDGIKGAATTAETQDVIGIEPISLSLPIMQLTVNLLL